ncbi:MAG: hypothetical protein KC646_12350 [Candidatus Cloacimonetes bacterium]|nr:hypothetical protein [Candidatus Cloacimonadota bacterium]
MSLFFLLPLTVFSEDKLQQYKNEFYKTTSSPVIKIRSVIRKEVIKPDNSEPDSLDFSFMEEKKPPKSKRKRKLKSFTLDKKIEKGIEDKSSAKKVQKIDPLEFQTHMILSQGKMHKNTSAVQLLGQLSKQNKDSAIPLKALAIYYLQKKQVKQAVPYLEKASFHENPSMQAIGLLKKYYTKNNKTEELSRLNQYLQIKLETTDQ